MIKFEKIHKTYPGAQPLHVLKGIDLEIEDGELVSIVGASGSGKSTMLNIMGMIDDYDSGDYWLDGILIKDQGEKEKAYLRNKYVGFIFQSYNLISTKNALENVTLPLFFRGVKRAERNEKGMEMLERVGLASHWNHLPSEMSGGQQQRVAIARAIVSHPRLILADEPTGALDSSTGQDVMNLLKKINREYNPTVIIVTHSPSISNQTDRKICIKDGFLTSQL